jgi:hypothetical protein
MSLLKIKEKKTKGFGIPTLDAVLLSISQGLS